MSTEVIVAVISGAVTVLSVLLSNARAGKDMEAKLDKSQAVTETKLDTLTQEVKKHNDFARRVPVIEEQIKVINHRISDLERK